MANRTDNTQVAFTVHNGVVRVLGESVSGDYDGDGNVTALDALAALRMSIGKLPVRMIMDVDHDGQVTAKDARLIMGMAVNAPPSRPQSLFGDWVAGDSMSPALIRGPTIVIGSASSGKGEVVSIPVTMHYE